MLAAALLATGLAPAVKLPANYAPSYKTDLPTGPIQSVGPKSDRARIGTLTVPRLAVGTIAWTPDTPADEARIARVAADAAEAGLDFVDTAERYGAKAADLIPAALNSVAQSVGLPPFDKTYQGGDCESNLARWGRDATVATKFTPKPDRRTAQSVVDTCRESAARLGVEQIPLYQIHMPDIIQPLGVFGVEDRKDEIYWDGLAECYHSGLAANVGVSNYGPTLLARCHAYLAERGVPLASNQICFSLLNRREGNLATVAKCKELGVTPLAYYPLAMGLLSGKLAPQQLRGKRDARSRDLLTYLEGGEGGTAGSIPEGGVRPLQRALHAVAASVKKTPAQVALNWVVCKGAIPVAGVSKPEHVRDNAGALGWRLTDADVAKLDAAADALPFDFRGAGFQTTDSKFVGYGFEKWRLD